MDDLKFKAGEKFEALHVAAKSAAGNGRSKVEDVYQHTSEALQRIREAFNEIWQHELVVESRRRVTAFTAETVRRIKEGAPPLSPMLLYEELKTLFRDRVWRKSMIIFLSGVTIGALGGLCVGARTGARGPAGPPVRALHATQDQAVMLIEDAQAPAVRAGEVLVRVQAFSVCWRDRNVLRGHAATLRTLLSLTPLCVGRGFAGVVLDVGPGVNALELGDEVWGCLSEWSGGAASELLTVRSTRISKRPRGMAADNAASLPWAGAMALEALHRLQFNEENCKGKRVLVCGAASGEGCALIQLLASYGTHITVSAPRHSVMALQDLGAHDLIEPTSNAHGVSSWTSVSAHAHTAGPWDALLLCAGAGCPSTDYRGIRALLKATAPRNAVVDLRPHALISDRLPAPLAVLFAASFYTFRILRWLVGLGSHTDWLEDSHRLTDGLEALSKLVDDGVLAPVLDKVYLPQDFETALAHACSEDSIGTTVIRFP